MFSILFAKVFMFFVILNLNSLVRAGSGDVLKDDNIDRGSRSDRGGLWFGPRLGKRSFRLASDGDDKGQVQAFLRLLEVADAVKYYYDQMPYYDPRADDPDMTVTKKVIFTPKLGRSLPKYDDKRFESDFTPRLGRGLAPQSNPEESYQEQTDDRIRYFSPRLGRNGVNFSPRLGRDIAYDHYPQNLRVVRSTNANKTKSD